MDRLGGHYANEVSQTKTNTAWYHLYVEPKKYNKLVTVTKKKQTHRYRQQTGSHQWREGRGEGKYRGRGVRGTNY